jgi:hypothetical protein
MPMVRFCFPNAAFVPMRIFCPLGTEEAVKFNASMFWSFFGVEMVYI